MQLRPRNVSSKQFTIDRSKKSMVAEASTLGFEAGEIFSSAQFQVWNDSCDCGLTLVSDKTQKEAVFVQDHQEVVDGDLLWWKLVPTPETLRKLPQLCGWTLVILND